LFYREVMRSEREKRAERIEDVNAGTAGGKNADRFLNDLRRS